MSLSWSEDIVAHCGTVCLELIAFVQWLAFDIFYVKVFGSQAWWFAMLPWSTRLFISDCVNWEEGPFAKTAFSVSLSCAFLLQKSPSFFFLISSFSAFFWNHLFGHDGVHLEPGPAWWKDTHSRSQPHCLTAPVSHKQDLNWHFTTYSFCKLSSVSEWRDTSLLGELFWLPKTFPHISITQSCIPD